MNAVAIRGYFDGNVCVPLEKTDFEVNEKVLITPLKNSLATSEIIDRFFGALDDGSAKAAMEVPENCRKIGADEGEKRVEQFYSMLEALEKEPNFAAPIQWERNELYER